MSEIEDLQRKIAQAESRKPSVDIDPAGHRAANEEITRLCDRLRVVNLAFVPRGFA